MEPFVCSEEVKCKSLSGIWVSGTPWTGARQAPLSMGFSRQESWIGLPFPSPGDLSDSGIEPGLLHCRQTLYCLSHQGSSLFYVGDLSVLLGLPV